jgi:hypothetical protein
VRSVSATETTFEDAWDEVKDHRKRFLALDFAGIMFVAAVEHAERGRRAYDALKPTVDSFKNLFAELGPLSKKQARIRMRGISLDDLTDNLREFRRLEPLYQPVVREYSLATVTAVAAAEAFVNEVADVLLVGQAADHFDRLTPQAKWLFLPAFIKKPCLFSLDRLPLQAFSAAVRTRNALIHFRGRRATFGAAGTPRFLEMLGLQPSAVEESIRAVRELVRRFSLAWTGSLGPDWLEPDSESFRPPCFYVGTREGPTTLYADELDAHRY